MLIWQDRQCSASGSTKHQKPALETLPSETLKIIFSYARPKDLASLARVSRAFRDLAAAQLYRTLSHVFTDDEKRDGQLSVDYLAGILETLTTADYNYARFIKEISIDTDTDASAEQAIREFKYEYTCGKFLNTLILATLKKITALESFRWNVRVEIGQSVFRILSKTSTLQNLHIRLQPGPSLHSLSITNTIQNPPPPSSISIPHTHQTPQFLTQPHSNSVVFVPTTNPPSFNAYLAPPKSTAASKNVKPARRLGISKPTVEPQNFSRFSGLRTLAILDIDSHEYIPEIAACVSSSSASLKSLKLSFSESLALKARRKMVAEISDIDTVVEDAESDDFGFQGMAPPPPLPPISNAGNTFGPTTTSSAISQADVRKERAAQEKVLARIFGLDKEDPGQKLLDVSFERAIAAAYRESQTAAKAFLKRDQDRLFVRRLKDISAEIRSNMSSAKGYPAKSLRALEKMEKAASKYLERKDHDESLRAAHGSFSRERKSTKADVPAPGESSHSHNVQPPGDVDNVTKNTSDGQYFDYLEKVLGDSRHPPTFPFSWNDMNDTKEDDLTPESKSQDQNTHADVSPSSELQSTQPEVTHTESVVDPISSFGAPGNHDGIAESDLSGPFKPGGIFGAAKNTHEDTLSDIVDMEHPDDDGDSGDDQESTDDCGDWNDDEATENQMGHTEESNASTSKGKEPVRNGITNVEEGRWGRKRAGEPSMEKDIQQYLRAHHGLPLESLSIYLIPVKANILVKAVDVTSLKHLSLLNVGPQSHFWATLAKLALPLSLTSIHTDNVTHSFLHFLDGHRGLRELFLFERSRKSKLASGTPRTTVGIEHIRRQVLKRHVGNLRRLVIRNDDNDGWVLNLKSILTLVKLGVNLEELMIGLNSVNFHHFMQQISGLRSLFALQILFHGHSRDGYNNRLVREMRYSIADTIVHCPSLPVEYVGVCCAMNVPGSDSVTQMRRTVRKPRAAALQTASRSTTKTDIKEKGKASRGDLESDHDGGPVQELLDEWAIEDSEEELEYWEENSPIVKTDVKMGDVVGVKMWEREIWRLRL
ncbi:hypothetical protein VTN77DRAFT_9425 [Rasamsonia byssochlamydoides]|uniref:uncharacterized protein n=1 Tax=Rasamsonia byssochlamydoides TaxID=89139 RepID=UPI003742D19C